MVDIMPEVNVFEHDAGSEDKETRLLWRANRRAVYRLAYKEREGKMHPASKWSAEKATEKELLEKTEPPRGMTWNDFGQLWDLHPEHPFTPVLRARSVDDDWHATMEVTAEALPTE